jgi:hypothetical protein
VEALDRQQALVLGALRRAAGAAVSYAELREAGVELPASVVSELELAGVGIKRCFGDGPGAVGVRLDPADDPAARPTPDPTARPTAPGTDPEWAWTRVRLYRASGHEGLLLAVLGLLSRPVGKARRMERPQTKGAGVAIAARAAVATDANKAAVREKRLRANPMRRLLAVTGLLAGIAVVSAFVAMWALGGERGSRAPIVKRPHPRVVVAAGGERPARTRRAANPAPRAPVSPALATELEAQGHGLLEAGRYGDAVPVLKRAVLATGETLGACLEPANSTCLTYAYALYDLGRAVRLSGEPQAAVPILERRLRIDNQRSVVGAELQLARRGFG